MTDKIKEITEKIYNEGIIKAKEDADQIIAEAKNKAGEIISLAKKEQEELIKKAQEQAEEIRTKTNAEMQLAARQFISKLKQQITGLISTSQVNGYIKEAFNDTSFLKEIILTIIKNWNPQKQDELNLKVLLPEKAEKEFSTFFDSKAIKTLNNGVEVQFDKKLENGFKIGPQDGSYLISFTDKDFENYFKGYFKDRTKKLLFESQDEE